MRGSARRAIVAGCCLLLLGACSSSTSNSTAGTPTTKPAPASNPSVSEQRPFRFTVRHETFVDKSRPTASPGNAAYAPDRVLATDLYIPTASTPRPLIMFSHGYHGAPRKFSQLFSAWAAAGYTVAAPRFPLTSNRGAPFDSVADLVNQPADISFVLTQLLRGPLRSRIDASRIAAAGLSLGGDTTYNLVEDACCRDARFRAAAVFDGVHVPIKGSFERNTIPMLIAHIDSDASVPYATALQAYAESVSPKFLLTYHTGTHAEAYENTPSPHDRTAVKTSTDFFDLTLLGDAGARARLLHDGDNPGESHIVAG
jgi:dienelactone hydrolase